MTLVDGIFGKDSEDLAILPDGGRSRNLTLTRVLIVLFLIGGVAGHLIAQTPSQPELAFDDAALRQQITQIYPTALPEMPQPWFNPPDAAKVALGEALFFDPNLSRCGTLACASCHRPEHGFASAYQVPPGCDGVRGRRRAPALYNVAYQGHYFWDGRVQSLEQQALWPVATPAEMGNVWDVVLTYLNTGRHIPTGKEYPQAHAFYAEYFAEVFNGDITPITVSHALAAYERTILTRDAAFDRWLAGDDASLTPVQKRGAERFFGRANCAVCHPPPLFTDDKFHNISIPQAGFETPHLFPANATVRTAAEAQGWPVPLDVDLGRQEVPPLQSSWSDLGAFKTPTLRNVALHGPYMHNGALATLADVMQHYENLAAGERQPLVGKLAFYVRYGKAHFGVRGGGEADDAEVMVAFMQALTGTQRAAKPEGVQPPRLGQGRAVEERQ
jgi:cytochrome c peroxidase